MKRRGMNREVERHVAFVARAEVTRTASSGHWLASARKHAVLVTAVHVLAQGAQKKEVRLRGRFSQPVAVPALVEVGEWRRGALPSTPMSSQKVEQGQKRVSRTARGCRS